MGGQLASPEPQGETRSAGLSLDGWAVLTALVLAALAVADVLPPISW
jgi:hypothetical protein